MFSQWGTTLAAVGLAITSSYNMAKGYVWNNDCFEIFVGNHTGEAHIVGTLSYNAGFNLYVVLGF